MYGLLVSVDLQTFRPVTPFSPGSPRELASSAMFCQQSWTAFQSRHSCWHSEFTSNVLNIYNGIYRLGTAKLLYLSPSKCACLPHDHFRSLDAQSFGRFWWVHPMGLLKKPDSEFTSNVLNSLCLTDCLPLPWLPVLVGLPG